MPDIVDSSTLTALIEWNRPPCVSILMPTERAGRETRQGPIRLRNLLDRARSSLVARGMRPPEADDLLGEARDLVEQGSFWQHQDDGLAVYTAPGHLAAVRLAMPLEETVVVADAFHVKPLLRVVDGDDHFNLLALSRNRVRLLWGRRHRIGEITVPDPVPTSLAEALWFEDREKQLQLHGANRAGQGRVVATFHGHGVPEEGDEARDRAFLRAVDRGVLQLVDRADPLVLAGVKEITALYRDVTGHPNVLDQAIAGNPDEATPLDLHERAWEIVEPHVRARDRQDREALTAAHHRSLDDLTEVVTASLAGRVEALWVPIGRQAWGRVGADGSVEVHDDAQSGDRDLLDLAAAATWKRGGRVHVVEPEEVPNRRLVAALLRY